MTNNYAAAMAALLLLPAVSLPVSATGFTVTLYDGTMYGPGNLGIHDINGGTLENFIVTAPLTGTIAFLNNDADLPNVYAEANHTGPIDGRLSDGTKINENVNAAFVIKVNEPETQEPVELFISSISEEIVEPDTHGNLVFKLHAAFDTGFAEDVVKMPVQFITGAVEVPISEKSRRGLATGHDQAGPFPAGTTHIGRLGDMDQDGYLDGVFMLAGNTPYELIIVEGDPVLIVRPFRSDIPITPQEAFFYELNGIVQNFPQAISSAVSSHKVEELRKFLRDIESRLLAASHNLERSKQFRKIHGNKISYIEEAPQIIKNAISEVNSAIKSLETGKKPDLEKIDRQHLGKMLEMLKSLHKDAVKERGRIV